MRLIAQAKQGFFPASPQAIAGILRHLNIPDPPPDKPGDVNILDPCAGEAKALVQLAGGLGVSKDHVYAVELNASRATRIAEAHPDVRLLGPCSFEATRITRHSFSLIYLNPPFDDQFVASGREEVAFLRQAIDLLVPGGILVQVCPVNQVFGASQMCELLDTWFEQLELYLFPDGCRSFRECVVFGRRRKTALTDALVFTEGILMKLMTETQTRPRLQGLFEWYDDKSIHIQARFDKVAPHQDRLVFISLGGGQPGRQALRAALAVGLSSPMRLKNVTLTKDGESEVPDTVWPSPSGYRLDAHRLGFGSNHALFTCRQQGFLPNDSDDVLWHELKQERFTTPLLRGWLPHVRKELELKSLLARCHTLECACCMLTAMSADLDSIVEFGLKNGLTTIQPEAA